jgi:hypothetical protein
VEFDGDKRLDEEKLEALRSWGERLGESSSEEHAAVGRAILMLVAEIDRLHIDLWHARMASSKREPVTAAEFHEEDAGERVASRQEGEQVASSLHGRLRRLLRRNEADDPVETLGHEESHGATAARDWIAELRRQK